MLNPFPIQFLSMLAYTLLRLGIGVILIAFGVRHAKRLISVSVPRAHTYWILVILELCVGAMFVLGLYTQIAALITMAASLVCLLFHKRFREVLSSRSFYALLFVSSLSLFITGAGALAFDLPI